MKKTFAIVAVAGLASASLADVIASQNFNGLSDAGTQTFDSLPAGSQLTNGGSANVGGGGIDFATFWAVDTRGIGTGPVEIGNDSSDFIGVNSFTGANSPDVSPNGTPVASGSEHNFEFNDGDGLVELRFAPVDVSGFTSRTLDLSLWINSTTYEADDFLFVNIEGNGGVTLLAFGELDLEGNSSADDGTANWLNLSFDLEPIIASLGEALSLTISVDTNAATENIFVDDISFNGVPTPGTLALLGLGGLAAARRRR